MIARSVGREGSGRWRAIAVTAYSSDGSPRAGDRHASYARQQPDDPRVTGTRPALASASFANDDEACPQRIVNVQAWLVDTLHQAVLCRRRPC